MKRLFFLWLLTGLFLPTPVFANEQASTEALKTNVDTSAEDQEVIALMDLLQMMELLQNFQMMTFEEEDK